MHTYDADDDAPLPDDGLELSAEGERYIHLIARGEEQASAARRAGFPSAYAAKMWARQPNVQRAVRLMARSDLASECLPAAVATLYEIVTDKYASAKIRLSAAKTIIEACGITATARVEAVTGSANQRDISEMGLEELDAFIRSGTEALDQQRRSAAQPRSKRRVMTIEMDTSTTDEPVATDWL